MADVLSQADIEAIQDSIAPATGDELVSTIEVWRKHHYKDGTIPGGGGVDAYGMPLNEGSVETKPDDRFEKIAEYPARITGGGKGSEPTIGDQTVPVSPWTITINWALNPDIAADDKLLVGRTPWVASTTYSAGDVVQPTESNERYYTCITAGESGATAPEWWREPIGVTVLDGDVVWEYTDKLRTFEVKDPGGETSYKVVRLVKCEEVKQ